MTTESARTRRFCPECRALYPADYPYPDMCLCGSTDLYDVPADAAMISHSPLPEGGWDIKVLYRHPVKSPDPLSEVDWP